MSLPSVVQADAYAHLSTWLVAPTTTGSFSSLIHPEIELAGTVCRVMVEQATCVNPQGLGDFAGRLDHAEARLIEQALRDVLDL